MPDSANLPQMETLPQTTQAMTPVSFGGHFGWLHSPAAGTSRGLGVVLVSPIGRDQRCAHMPMRLFADQLAQAGFSVLRYDHLSTGDSADHEPFEADVVSAWLEGVNQAVDTLKQMSGLARVVAGGVRLGALLAAQSADKLDGLLLLAPVTSGRSWVKRLRFSAVAARETGTAPEAGVDTDGIFLSAASTARLEGLDMQALSSAGNLPVFVAAQNQLGYDFADSLSQSGLKVTQTSFAEFRELFLDAHSNLPPQTLFDEALEWLNGFAPAKGAHASAIPLKAAVIDGAGWTETPATLADDLYGVLCKPDQADASAPAVLFVNTGGDPRAGIGGFAAQAARSLAETGVTSLRFDFAGLGDSAFAGEGRCHVYETPRHADVQIALEVLDHPRVVIVGICAGAYHALHESFTDPRIVGVLGVSPVKLLWKTGDTQDFAKKAQAKSLKTYQNAAFKPETWLRLLKGKLDIPTLTRNIGAQLKNRIESLIFAPRARKLRADVQALAGRGVHITFVAGFEDASIDELESLFGRDCQKLKAMGATGQAQAVFLPDLDHGLARHNSRRMVLGQLRQMVAGLTQAAAKSVACGILYLIFVIQGVWFDPAALFADV